MNFSESAKIKQKIDESQKILLNFHHNPDADSVGSAISLSRILTSWGKETKIVSPTIMPKNLQFVLHHDPIDVRNFTEFEFNNWDLFITTDSSSWPRVCGSSDFKKPDLPFVVIDHHKSNTRYGDLNLVIDNAAANCEVLFKLYNDWEVKLEEKIAEPLLMGIIGDTGGFRFPEADLETFNIAQELMKFTDKNRIIFNLFQSYEQSHLILWKELIENIQIDVNHKFVYSFANKEAVEKAGKPFNAKSELADMLFQSFAETDFGIVGVEDEDYITVSFRSRTGKDMSALAQKFGGGGHQWAAAARVYKPYEEAINIILEKTREFASEND